MNITGILLAAGKSTRMTGQNKLLLPFRGYTVVEEVLCRMINANLNKIYVILGHESEQLQKLLTSYQSERVQLLINSVYEAGRASSIKVGIEKCDETIDGALFMVADKPTIKSDLINQVIGSFAATTSAITAVKTPNGRGHPIIFNRSLFTELLELNGDVAGENLITKYDNEISWVEDDEVQLNINSPADYQKLLAAELGNYS